MALALFDLDNTLISGDSDHLWGEFLCEIGAVDRIKYGRENDRFFEDYQNGNLDIIAYNEFCLEPLTRHPIAQLHQWRDQFLEEIISPIILAPGQKQIEYHRQLGDDIVIITATNEFITKPISQLMNVTHLIATTPEVKKGEYTGKLSGTPCFKEGKVVRLNDWIDDHKLDFKKSTFYSDSHNDLPLLLMVDTAVAVDPDERLLQFANKKNWSVMSFRDELP